MLITRRFSKQMVIFLVTAFFCVVLAGISTSNYSSLRVSFSNDVNEYHFPISAKYEKDGKVYIIDKSHSRINCLSVDGTVLYTISADEKKEYQQFFETAADEDGRLFVYEASQAVSAFHTLQDRVRYYDKNGQFIEDIFVFEYSGGGYDNPNTNPRINSLVCNNGKLTFSMLQPASVLLYSYDILSGELQAVEFDPRIYYRMDDVIPVEYAVTSLCLRDFKNFVYTTHGGSIFEVKDGGAPRLVDKWNFSLDTGGRQPLYPRYDVDGSIVAADIISGMIMRLDENSPPKEIIPLSHLVADGAPHPRQTIYGCSDGKYAGICCDVPWYFDGKNLTMYTQRLLPAGFTIKKTALQLSLVLSVIFFMVSVYILFIYILKRRLVLFIRQVLVMMPVFIISFFVLYWVMDSFWTKRFYQNIKDDITRYAETSAAYFDGNKIESIRNSDDCLSAAYHDVCATLLKITRNNLDSWNEAYYALIFVIDPDKQKSPVDKRAYYIAVSNYAAVLFSPRETSEIEMAALNNGEAYSEVGLDADGFWGYSVIPIVNSRNEISAFLEVGRDMSSFEIMMREQRGRAAFFAFIISLFIAGVIMLLMLPITRQLSKLAKAHEMIFAGNYKIRLKRRQNDELGDVIQGFNQMADDLESKLGAEEANRAKSDFLANMSHEIRTPMNAVLGMTELMPTSNLNSLQIEYLDNIKKTSYSLLQIINDILDFSKVEAGKLELIPVHFNLVELYQNICSMCEFSAQQKKLEFISSYKAPVPPVVFGDEIRIRQIITNLLGNAIKYTHEGSVTIQFAWGRFDAPSLDKGKNYYRIIITDTGIGIQKENIPKLFSSYQQFDTKKNRNILGTGLGLVITKRFVELMDGKITVESIYGQGSSFTVYLPLPMGDSEKIEHKKSKAKNFVVANHDIQVLVVDDTQMNLSVAKGFLERHNIHADTAESGAAAIEMVQQKKYDLIFMDHMMPDMDGIETTQHIRALGAEFVNLPIVALTANAITGMHNVFIDGGMNGYLTKPINAAELNGILLKWLPSEKIDIQDHSDMIEAHTTEPDDSLGMDDISHIAGLNVSGALARTGTDKTAYKSMLTLFCNESKKLIKEMRKLAAENSHKEFVIKIHAFKGICGSIGADSLFERALVLESSGGANIDNDIAAVFCADAEQLADEIATALKINLKVASRIVVDKSDLAERLAVLRTVCHRTIRGEIGAGDELESLVAEAECIRCTVEYDAALDEICALVRDFEYETALIRIEYLIALMEQTEWHKQNGAGN